MSSPQTQYDASTQSSIDYLKAQLEASKKAQQNATQNQIDQKLAYQALQDLNKQAVSSSTPTTITTQDIQAQKQVILDRDYLVNVTPATQILGPNSNKPIVITPETREYRIPYTDQNARNNAIRERYAQLQGFNNAASQRAAEQVKRDNLTRAYENFRASTFGQEVDRPANLESFKVSRSALGPALLAQIKEQETGGRKYAGEITVDKATGNLVSASYIDLNAAKQYKQSFIQSRKEENAFRRDAEASGLIVTTIKNADGSYTLTAKPPQEKSFNPDIPTQIARGFGQLIQGGSGQLPDPLAGAKKDLQLDKHPTGGALSTLITRGTIAFNEAIGQKSFIDIFTGKTKTIEQSKQELDELVKIENERPIEFAAATTEDIALTVAGGRGAKASPKVRDVPISVKPTTAKEISIRAYEEATGQVLKPENVEIVGLKTVKTRQKFETVPANKKPSSYELVTAQGENPLAVITKKGTTVPTPEPLNIFNASKKVGQRVNRSSTSFEDIKPSNNEIFAKEYTSVRESEATGLRKATPERPIGTTEEPSGAIFTEAEKLAAGPKFGESKTYITDNELVKIPETKDSGYLTYDNTELKASFDTASEIASSPTAPSDFSINDVSLSGSTSTVSKTTEQSLIESSFQPIESDVTNSINNSAKDVGKGVAASHVIIEKNKHVDVHGSLQAIGKQFGEQRNETVLSLINMQKDAKKGKDRQKTLAERQIILENLQKVNAGQVPRITDKHLPSALQSYSLKQNLSQPSQLHEALPTIKQGHIDLFTSKQEETQSRKTPLSVHNMLDEIVIPDQATRLTTRTQTRQDDLLSFSHRNKIFDIPNTPNRDFLRSVPFTVPGSSHKTTSKSKKQDGFVGIKFHGADNPLVPQFSLNKKGNFFNLPKTSKKKNSTKKKGKSFF